MPKTFVAVDLVFLAAFLYCIIGGLKKKHLPPSEWIKFCTVDDEHWTLIQKAQVHYSTWENNPCALNFGLRFWTDLILQYTHLLGLTDLSVYLSKVEPFTTYYQYFLNYHLLQTITVIGYICLLGMSSLHPITIRAWYV